MSTGGLLLFAAAVGLLSSLLTAAAVVVIGRRWLTSLLDELPERAGGEVADRVREAVTEVGEEFLPEFEERVRTGFAAAVDEALPRVRQEVAEGVKDGLVGAADPKTVVRVGENVAKASSSILEKGLNLVFGDTVD